MYIMYEHTSYVLHQLKMIYFEYFYSRVITEIELSSLTTLQYIDVIKYLFSLLRYVFAILVIDDVIIIYLVVICKQMLVLLSNTNSTTYKLSFYTNLTI